MTALRYGWLGVTRRQALAGTLDSLLGEWVGDWCMQCDIDKPRAQIATEWPHGANLAKAKGFRSAAGQSACHVRGLRHAALGRWLMDLQDDDGVGLAEALAAESLSDLSRRIHAKAMGSDPMALTEIAKPVDPDAFRAWAGALHAQVQLGRIELDLLLDRDLCVRIAQPPAGARHTLASRAGALAGAPLRLEAMLDFGSANLADLSNLQVGELLVSDRPLTTLISLGHGGKPVASAQLCRTGDRLALRMQTTQE